MLIVGHREKTSRPKKKTKERERGNRNQPSNSYIVALMILVYIYIFSDFFFYFQCSFQSANKFLLFPFCHLFQPSMSSFHPLMVFLKLQLKDIVHKLTSL